MQKITYSAELIKLRALFEGMTGAKLKDCFYDTNNNTIFVAEEGEAARAIGKNGNNAKRVERLLRRKIRIIEFNPKPEAFLASLIMPARAKNIYSEAENLIIEANDTKARGMIIGRGAANLRSYEKTMQRYFRIKEIKVR